MDFGIAMGGRTVEEQRTFYLAGKSKVNPDSYATPQELAKAAKHVIVPGVADKSRAVDIYVFVPGQNALTYDHSHICYLAGVIMATARMMGIPVRWGGNWDRDGEVVTDQSFDDLVHFEMD